VDLVKQHIAGRSDRVLITNVVVPVQGFSIQQPTTTHLTTSVTVDSSGLSSSSDSGGGSTVNKFHFSFVYTIPLPDEATGKAIVCDYEQ
jgi:hypothetical protein